VRWLVQLMDQGAIEGAMSGASNGSGSTRRSDGWCKRCVRELLMERWLVQAMDQGAIEGASVSMSG
jgi:hypothetical protein